jgi:transglutaminase-like putative cysteine protease
MSPREFDREYDEADRLDAFVARLRPDEGWVSLVLVLVMAGTMAWSIADARWILGRDELTSFIIWIALAAALWGYLSSRLPIAPWIAHSLGAVLGAFVVIEVVGSILPNADASVGGWFQATAQSVAEAYLDLTWRHQSQTFQYGHFCMILGIIVWGTVQAASYDVFGHHRAINAVLLLAMVLLANMAVTIGDQQGQFAALVVLSAAGLWLLVGSHEADVRSGWQRHRIWRAADVGSSHAQGGLRFAALAVCGALLLTSVASSAPLGSYWRGFDGNFRDFATWISAYLPAGGHSRFGGGADFGSSTTVATSFQSSTSVVLTISALTPGASNSHWRVIAYDNFKTNGWASGGGSQSDLPAGDELNAGTLDQVDPDLSGRSRYTYRVDVVDQSLQHLLEANEPLSVTVPVTRVLAGTLPAESGVVWFPTDATSYTVTAVLPNLDPSGVGLTEWRLRQAGTDYPTGLLTRYTQGTTLIGRFGQSLLQDIEESAAEQGVAVDKGGHFTNAYDAAKAMQEFLRDPTNFAYQTNITDLVSKCAALSTVDCFAEYKRGFCEQYATTMTMLMRMEGYPARYVEGYLSGPVSGTSVPASITGQQRHAWVEVYFPGYGWIPFDPTGGSVGQPTELPAGSPALPTPTPSPAATSASGSGAAAVTRRPLDDGSTAGGSAGTGGSAGGLLLPGGIAICASLGLVVLLWRRPQRLQTPEAVYRSVVRLATRLGYKPLPTQTVYEYTGMLAEVVPRARVPLDVVAKAQVEVAYGRRVLPTDRLVILAGAQRRVRQSLLRLAIGLPRIGRRRSRTGKTPGR